MPTYEYECKSCKYTFDVFQSMADEPIKICPQCGKDVRRLINGGFGVIFKGSGFYVTDKNGSKSASDSKSDASKSKPDSAAGSANGKDSSGNSASKSASPAPACSGCPAANKTGSCPKTADN